MLHSYKLTWLVIVALLTLGKIHAQFLPAHSTLMTRFEKIRPSEGVFIVTKDGKMGVASPKGHLLTQLEYDTIYNFREGMAVVGRGKREVNQFGKVLSDFKYGYLTKSGRLVVPTQYYDAADFNDGLGLAYVGSADSDLGHYIYFSNEGKATLRPNPVYNSSSFQGNLAFVEVPKQGFWLPPYKGRNNGSHTQLYDVDGETIYGNYINRLGQLMIPFQYDTIAPFFSGYLRLVRKGGKWGFLDSTALLKVPLLYDDIDADSAFFWQNKRRVGINGRFGFLDVHTGRLVVPLAFDDTRPSQSPLVWVHKQGRWGCLTTQNRIIIPFQFDDVQPFEPNARAAVKQHGKWALIDDSGKTLSLFQYENIMSFQEDRAIVKRAGKFGFLDSEGHEIIPASYDGVSPFVRGHAFAKRCGLFVTLDVDGNWVKIKLQPSTFKWLLISLICMAAFFWAWQKRKNHLLRQTTV